LISDKRTGGLGVVALDLAEGLWCFKDEIEKKARESYSPGP